MIEVWIKHGASQAHWIKLHLTRNESVEMFRSLSWNDMPVAYIWPQSANIIYDCEARQWTSCGLDVPVSQKYLDAAKAMTVVDRMRVRALISFCARYKEQE